MRKTIAICLIALLLILSCMLSVGCALYDKIYAVFNQPTSLPAFYSVLVCSVPGTGDRFTRAGKIEVLETDSYGRTLFKHVQPSSNYYNYSNSFCAYVICQNNDSDGAYYLRDINFALSDGEENMDESRIDSLKARNGWEHPLDLNSEGMMYTPLFTFDRFLDLPEEANGYYYECGIIRGSGIINLLRQSYPECFPYAYVYLCCYAVYDDGKAIYIASNTENTDALGFSAYLLATYSDGKLYEGCPLPIEEPFTEGFYQQIAQFRADFEAAAAEHN